MTLLDEPARRGKIYQDGWTQGPGRDAAVIDITPYPFQPGPCALR